MGMVLSAAKLAEENASSISVSCSFPHLIGYEPVVDDRLTVVDDGLCVRDVGSCTPDEQNTDVVLR